MTILSHVCVDFTDKSGRTIFSVTPPLIDCVLTAPDEIQADPIFDLLLSDRSLEAVRTVEQRKRLENDPFAGQKTRASKKEAANPAEGQKATLP